MTMGDFVLYDTKHLFIKFKISDTELATGKSGRALAFKKLFNELKPLVGADIKA